MSTATTSRPLGARTAGDIRRMLTSRAASAVAIVIALLWTVPTLGLLVSSFRPELAIKTTGWWTFFSDPEVTLANYQDVLFSSGTSGGLANYFINSLLITVPGVLFPLVLACLAAYAFSVMSWKGRDWVFIVVFGLQIVPIQMTLIPLLQIFVSSGLNKSMPFATVWIAHTIFALPLAVFLLHNFMSEIPRELVEAARVDGAGHLTVFSRVVLPLMVPAIVSFGIFQFLWVWNDLLVSLTFTGGSPKTAPLTVRLAEMAGTHGDEWQRLTAGGFISMIVPLVVFLLLQKYFVRGMLAGSVKG